MKNSARNRPKRKNLQKSASISPDGPIWLWGTHAVSAALANPRRTCLRLCVTQNALSRLPERAPDMPEPEILSPKEIDDALPRDAVHQGMAARFEQLEDTPLEDMLGESRLIVFDQLTDPHNIGAIFRSAAAFGFTGAVLQTRNVPPLTGIAAKTAAGALEAVREVRVVNISRALETLNDAGFQTIGLDGSGELELSEALADCDKLAIVIGAEGSGLRPGVAKSCTRIARIPIERTMESLNASNAAAIAFYEASRK